MIPAGAATIMTGFVLLFPAKPLDRLSPRRAEKRMRKGVPSTSTAASIPFLNRTLISLLFVGDNHVVSGLTLA